MENDELKNNEIENLDSETANLNLEPEAEEIIEGSFVNEQQRTEPFSEEDTPEEMPIEQEKEETEEVQPTKKSSNWFRKSLIFLMVAVLLVLAGFLISYFTFTVPNQNAYQSVMSELTSTKAELENLQSQFDQISADLQEAQNKYMLAQGENVTLQHDYNDLLTASEFNLNLVNLKYEVGLARFAMLDKDAISARQSLSLASNYFDAIQSNLDQEISSGIADRLASIQSSITSNATNAANELRTLAENLERIPLK